ncbi:hypothetical protein [Mangrovibacter plantisponsor]|uniref:Uncharacterized protein n=1 Tax=Mangrovibacter plantisponsor TaxID=451513 RepID=A0A317Q7A5_9ENTR|nr:hypothetical protein [Mangrovibacter plantisponsor]PWW11640.1 hypothetical protein DES37_102248 [Mangrovibacter plantisponsor]
MICFYTLFYNFVHIAFITAELPERTVVVRDGVMEVQPRGTKSTLPVLRKLRAVSITLLSLTRCARRPQGALARQARLNDSDATLHTRL